MLHCTDISLAYLYYIQVTKNISFGIICLQTVAIIGHQKHIGTRVSEQDHTWIWFNHRLHHTDETSGAWSLSLRLYAALKSPDIMGQLKYFSKPW